MKDEERINVIKKQIVLSKELIALYNVSKKKEHLSKIEKLEKEIKDCNKELNELYEKIGGEKEGKKEPVSNNRTQIENDIIDAIKTTALGREGMLPIEFMTYEGQAAMKKLEKEKVVRKLEPIYHYNYLPQETCYGLVGEEYPKNADEWQSYRDSGYSDKVSFKEFKQLVKEKKVLSNDEVEKIFNECEAEFLKSLYNGKPPKKKKGVKKGEDVDNYWNYIEGKTIFEPRDFMMKKIYERNHAKTVLLLTLKKFKNKNFEKLKNKPIYNEVLNLKIK